MGAKLGGALLAAPGGVRNASRSRKRLPSRAYPPERVFQRNRLLTPRVLEFLNLLLLRPQHFFELLHLRSYDEPAISLIRVFREVILMIILRLVKSLERHDLGHYWIGPIFLRFSFHLFSNRFLIVILIQDN